MAKPKSRPRLEGARYRSTRQAAHSYLTCLPHTLLTHIAHTYQFPSSHWARALDRYGLSAGVQSRLADCPQRTNERAFGNRLWLQMTMQAACSVAITTCHCSSSQRLSPISLLFHQIHPIILMMIIGPSVLSRSNYAVEYPSVIATVACAVIIVVNVSCSVEQTNNLMDTRSHTTLA